jgi:hypothetical protein
MPAPTGGIVEEHLRSLPLEPFGPQSDSRPRDPHACGDLVGSEAVHGMQDDTCALRDALLSRGTAHPSFETSAYSCIDTHEHDPNGALKLISQLNGATSGH